MMDFTIKDWVDVTKKTALACLIFISWAAPFVFLIMPFIYFLQWGSMQ
jgi:hypothetical protein